MDLTGTFVSLIISLGLGLLVGLQRERASPRLGGIRTFGLITLLGTLSAMLAQSLGGWIVAAGLIGVASATVVGNFFPARRDDSSHGITTEIAMLAMFGVGAYVVVGPREVAVAMGATVAILLHAKPVLHGIVNRLGDNDVRAIMQFALISLVILPVVPDRTFGPFDVLNPHNIWLMVVLVVGISLGGYIAYRFIGGGAGLLLGGVLGGLISSTATTVSFARRSAKSPAYTRAAAAVIMIASTVVYARLFAEISVVAPHFLATAAGPLGVLAGVSAALAIAAWFGCRGDGDGLPAQANPTELKSALVFGGLYAVVLVAVAAARQYFGHSGLYAVSGISGLTDMDAITLSVSRMTVGTDGSERLGESTAWRAIVIAAMSNVAFKGVMVGVLGCPALTRRIAVLFGVKLAAAGAVLVFWPG